MAIDAITSGGAAAAAGMQMRARPVEADEQTRKAESNQVGDRARLEREAAERARVDKAQEQQKAQADEAKPTVNAEGQKVGTRVNITA